MFIYTYMCVMYVRCGVVWCGMAMYVCRYVNVCMVVYYVCMYGIQRDACMHLM